MISSDVEYWINCIDSYEISDKASGRPILIWGAYSKGSLLCDSFEKQGFEVNGFIDGHKGITKYQGKDVYKPQDILLNKTYYVVVAIEGVRSEIKTLLNDNDYKKDVDYFYFSEHMPDIAISRMMGEYCDIYNNRFVYEGEGSIDVNIHCVGGDNTIIIGKNFNGDSGLTLNLSYGGSITLGERFVSQGDALIDVSGGGRVFIGNNCNFMKDTHIRAKYGGDVKIGDYVSCGERLHVTSGRLSKVSVGQDCMLSHDISILGTNSHSILDCDTKENRSVKTERPIKIGNHVWLGKGVSILYGTEIGEGSVVGLQSLLKGVYPPRSIIVGNIAKVIRENCTWDRRRDIEFEEL